jgi:hypothetical protein
MQRLEVSCAVRYIYIYIYIYVVRRQKVKCKEVVEKRPNLTNSEAVVPYEEKERRP